MTLAPLKLYPDDPKQAVRMRRFYMGSATAGLVIFLISLCTWLGFIETRVFWIATALIFAIMVMFFALFQSRLNLKFRDPSLTSVQILAAGLTMIYVMHNAGAARGIFLIVILMIFVFGIFRLGAREFMQIAILLLAAYALLIWPRIADRHLSSDDSLAILYGVVLAVVLPWFAMMGAYIGRLRRQLSESMVELESSQALAVRDDLTGVYNRRYLMGALHKEKNRGDRGGIAFSVCMIDIDFFKRINDSKGHLVGDQVLKALSAVLQRDVRTTDCFGRFGGEEFLLVLSETSLEGACVYAERVRKEIEALQWPEFQFDGAITVSIGVTQYRPREEIATTLARADRALYQAKARGRNRIHCDRDVTNIKTTPHSKTRWA